MAVQAAVCSPVSQLQLPVVVARAGSASAVDCVAQRAVVCRSSSLWQGRRLVVVPLPVGQKKTPGIARAEQAEAVTSTTTSVPRAETKLGRVTEVDKDTFWPVVESAGEKVVVLDMYTQWCGPCKMMLPKIVELSEKLDDVIFVKLDCNQHNKSLAKELGIRVVPTFKIFKNNKLVGEVTGAKFPDLVSAIDKTRKGEPI